MSDKDRPPKYKRIPLNHLPTWKKPVKFLLYLISVLVFNFLTYREVSSRSLPEGGSEGNSMLGRFQYWFYFRARKYILIVIIIVLAILIYDSCLYPKNIPIQVYGIAINAFGALIIARGLYRGYGGLLTDADLFPQEVRNAEKFGIERPTNYEKMSLDSSVRESVDAILAGAMLVIGSLIQIMAIL